MFVKLAKTDSRVVKKKLYFNYFIQEIFFRIENEHQKWKFLSTIWKLTAHCFVLSVFNLSCDVQATTIVGHCSKIYQSTCVDTWQFHLKMLQNMPKTRPSKKVEKPPERHPKARCIRSLQSMIHPSLYPQWKGTHYDVCRLPRYTMFNWDRNARIFLKRCLNLTRIKLNLIAKK